MSDIKNFIVTQGIKWELDIAYTDEQDVPIDISDYTILVEVRDKPGGSILCATATNGDGITMIDNGDYNSFNMIFTGAKTRNFTYPRAAYQIKIVETDDELASGWLEVNPGVIE